MNRDRIRDKVLGSLMSVFIGDALGLPAECQSPESIKRKFGYIDWFESNRYHPYQSVAKQQQGSISDDSQLTLAMMDAINNGYSIENIKQSHIEAYEGKWGDPVGWGKTTVSSIKKIKNNEVDTFIQEGAGNGPVIKIAPFAIYCVYRTGGKFSDSFNLSLLKKCQEISRITHGDAACVVAAYCHCKMIIRALQDEIPETSHLIAGLFIDDAIFAEKELNNPTCKFSDRLQSILLWRQNTPGDDLDIFDLSTAKVSKMICTSQSSYIYNSYPLVAYCCAKYLPYKNFQYIITETVNAGADADSNASMVGSIVGAMLGMDEIPVIFIKGLLDWKVLFENASRFEQLL